MSTVLQFRTSSRTDHRKPVVGAACEIVIFPGVRIERHDDGSLDLGHRMRDAAGKGDFDGMGGGRPRKTS